MEKPRKKSGPPAKLPPMQTATVRLEPWMVEWGKARPGGLSALVRRLINDEYELDQTGRG